MPRNIWFFLIAFIIILASGSPFYAAASSGLSMLSGIEEPVTSEFGEYIPIRVKATPAVPPYAIADDFSNIANIGQFQFTDEQKALLCKNGFVAIPSDFKEMYDIYNQALNESLPVFVTVDSVLHAFHEQFDYILRSLETRYFFTALQSMTQALLDGSIDQLSKSSDPKIQSAIHRNIAYFSIANQLINPASTTVGDEASIVAQELELIQNHAGMAGSPLFGTQEDYSQYVPRGHYTLSGELKRYFLAMTWYGRITFHNQESSQPYITRERAENETRQALLIVQLMNSLVINGEPIQSLWERIYQPTAFLVGQSDDLNLRDYTLAARAIFGLDFAQLPPDRFSSDPSQLAAFMNYPNRPSSQISPIYWGMGFRLMGQRFLPDGYMVQTINPGMSGRDISGLEIMAVLGSDHAFEILEKSQIDLEKHHQLREKFAAYPPSVWAQNIYWNWLYCLMPMLAPKGEGFPTFMQSEAWRDKDLSCALGSWAELRHDTILYAKPSYYGGVDDSTNAFESEYVEPNPWAFARLAALSRYLLDGLGNLDLLPDENDYRGGYFTPRLHKMLEVTETLQTISEKELTLQPITVDERRFIRTFGDPLTWLCTIDERELSSDMGTPDANRDDMAVIADVFTNTETNKAVEVGVGRPLTIYTVIGSGDRLSIAVGSAFSYYEFSQPMNERLTDEAWRKMLDESRQPSQPEWTQSYAAPAIVSTPPDILEGPSVGYAGIGYTLSLSSQHLLQGDQLIVRLIFDAKQIEEDMKYYKEKVEKKIAIITSSLIAQIAVNNQLIEKQLVFDNWTSEPYDYSAVFDTTDWPKGDYEVMVYNPASLAISASKSFMVIDDILLMPTPTPTLTNTPTPTQYPTSVLIMDSIDSTKPIYNDIDPNSNRMIVIRWNPPAFPCSSYQVMVSRNYESQKKILGQTQNNVRYLVWSSVCGENQTIADEFADGPQHNSRYVFYVYGESEGRNEYIGEMALYYFVEGGDINIPMPPTPAATPSPTSIYYTPTPLFSPTPSPLVFEIAENTLIVTDDLYAADNLLGSFDVDNPNDPGLAIRWKFSKETFVDFHVYVSVNGNPIQYLGRTGDGDNSFLEWRKNGVNLSETFGSGPQFGKQYRFVVFGLTAEGTNDRIESSQTIDLIATNDSTPTIRPTATPTAKPVSVDRWRLYD